MKNITNSTGNVSDVLAYKKQRNLVVNINRRTKNLFLKRAGEDPSQNGLSFWKKSKPLFLNKFTSPDDRVFLPEKDELISNEKQISNIFNDYFVNITSILPLTSNLDSLSETLDDISKYANHRSILKIISQGFHDSFEFEHVYPWEVRTAILSRCTFYSQG